MTHAIIEVATGRVVKDCEGHLHIYSTEENARIVLARDYDGRVDGSVDPDAEYKVVPW